MKSSSLYSKLIAGLCLAFLLMFAGQVKAQSITDVADLFKGGDALKGTSTSGTTVFCSGSGAFTLVSTKSTGASPDVLYTSWTWSELQADGSWSATIQSGAPVPSDPNKLQVTNAEPGWHTYRVLAGVSAAGCLADPVLFTVYVIPPLGIDAKANKATDDELTFCAENGAPGSATPQAITFTATPKFTTAPRAVPGSAVSGGGTATQLPALAIGDFKINYKWYKVEVGVGGTGTLVGTNNVAYTIDDATTTGATAVKQYTYRVEATYALKDCGTQSTTALHSAGTTTATVTVTPKPAAPVITIE